MPPNRTIILTLLLLLLLSCQSAKRDSMVFRDSFVFPVDQKPKNIVLMVGDGMGLSQVSALLYSNSNRMELEKFPVIGFHKTYSHDNLITDSAAGATAFACGVKTYNGAIGLTADTLPTPSIMEEVEMQGMATGIVVTSTVNHATPAAFYAHQKVRILFDQIAADLLNTEIDFIVGGGRRYFDNREIDDRNLYEELQEKGYLVTDYMQGELRQMGIDSERNFIYFTGDTDPPAAGVGRNYLPYASKKALHFLEEHSDKGFFLLIEGSQIDWACHNQKDHWAIDELKDFDQAIGEVIEYAREDGNTLVIVTADHETGGMSINEGSKINRLKTGFTSNGHTAALVPVFAYGPSADLFGGIYENTEIYKKMRQALGLAENPTSALND